MTAPPEQVRVECPACGHVYTDWRRPSINADLDPEMATDRDYMERARSATCPECGHRVYFETLVVEGNVFRATRRGRDRRIDWAGAGQPLSVALTSRLRTAGWPPLKPGCEERR